MKKENLNNRVILKQSLSSLLKINKWALLIVMFTFIASCKPQAKKKGYIAFYNYSNHGDITIGYAEITIPVSFNHTISIHNKTDYSIERYTKGAELLTSKDTFDLMYIPLKLKNQFYTLSKKQDEKDNYSSYIFLFEEPYNGVQFFKWIVCLCPVLRILKRSGI